MFTGREQNPYVIRITSTDLTINAGISTANAAQVRWGVGQSIENFLGMRLFEAAPGVIEANINDNGDDKDDIDVRFQISDLTAIDYTIENSGNGCKP